MYRVRLHREELPMNFKNKIAENWLKYIVLLAFAVFCMEYWDTMRKVADYFLTLLAPFIMGGCVAFVMNLPMRFIERMFFVNRKTSKLRRFGRTGSLFTTVLLLLGITAAVLLLIVPQLARTTGELVETITDFSMKQENYLVNLWTKYPEWQGWIEKLQIDWRMVLEHGWEFARNGLGGFLTSTVDVIRSIVFQVTNFCIGTVFAIYLLYSKELLASQAKRLLYSYIKKEKVDRLLYILSLTQETFSGFLTGQCLEACILGCMFFLTMLLLGLPYPLLIGVVIAITALVPIFGSFVGLGVGVFLIVTTRPMDAVVFTILFFILQQLEENLIYPHVVGSSVGLPSIWVMVAVTLGGSLMGIVGMLIFLPIASVLYTLIREQVNERTKQ